MAKGICANPECTHGKNGGRAETSDARKAKLCRICWRERGADLEERPSIKCRLCGQPTSHWKNKHTGKGFCRQCFVNRNAEVMALAGPTPDSVGPDASRDALVARLRGETAIYKKAYEQTTKERADEERLIELFRSSLARFPALPASAFRLPAPKPHRPFSPEVPAVIIGDQQIGERISSEETFGINAYSFEIYQARLEHLEDRVIDILTDHQRAPFKELVVFSMGDNVSGVIHEELQKHGHQHIVDQVYLGALTQALFLWRLLARLRPRGIQKIRVSGVSGNHGRLSKEKEAKLYFKNYDWLFNNIVATALKGVPEIEFHLPRCLFTVVDVAGSRVLQSHGHELPPSSLGIPLYSVNRASAGYQELLSWSDSSRFDYWIIAHFHRPMELDNAIVNGTMAGLSEFGIGKFKPIRPMQRLLGFTEKWGLSWQYPIRLDKAPAAPKIYTFGPDMATTDALDLLQERMGKPA